MNTHILKGKWTEAKGALQNMWGKLTDNELEETKGNVKSIAGLVRQKYGHAKDDLSAKLDEVLGKFTGAASDAQEDAGEYMADKSEELKDAVKSSRPYPKH